MTQGDNMDQWQSGYGSMPPYTQPQYQPGWPQPMHGAPHPPAVWPWFVVYAVMMAIVYLLLAGLGVVFLVVDPRDLDMEPAEALIVGVIYLGMGTVLTIPFAIAPFLPKRKWVWIYDIVLIALGMTSICCLPMTIPLLLYWIKPETRAYFGYV